MIVSPLGRERRFGVVFNTQGAPSDTHLRTGGGGSKEVKNANYTLKTEHIIRPDLALLFGQSYTETVDKSENYVEITITNPSLESEFIRTEPDTTSPIPKFGLLDEQTINYLDGSLFRISYLQENNDIQALVIAGKLPQGRWRTKIITSLDFEHNASRNLLSQLARVDFSQAEIISGLSPLNDPDVRKEALRSEITKFTKVVKSGSGERPVTPEFLPQQYIDSLKAGKEVTAEHDFGPIQADSKEPPIKKDSRLVCWPSIREPNIALIMFVPQGTTDLSDPKQFRCFLVDVETDPSILARLEFQFQNLFDMDSIQAGTWVDLAGRYNCASNPTKSVKGARSSERSKNNPVKTLESSPGMPLVSKNMAKLLGQLTRTNLQNNLLFKEWIISMTDIHHAIYTLFSLADDLKTRYGCGPSFPFKELLFTSYKENHPDIAPYSEVFLRTLLFLKKECKKIEDSKWNLLYDEHTNTGESLFHEAITMGDFRKMLEIPHALMPKLSDYFGLCYNQAKPRESEFRPELDESKREADWEIEDALFFRKEPEDGADKAELYVLYTCNLRFNLTELTDKSTMLNFQNLWRKAEDFSTLLEFRDEGIVLLHKYRPIVIL